MKHVAVVAAGALTLVMTPSFTRVQLHGGETVSVSLVCSARADEGWKREFEEVCGRTEDSMGMTVTELKELLSRCDKLRPLIEAQEETTRKVYLRRLQMCRDLLAYVYEVKSRR